MFSEFDRLAMTRALALAERGMETTHPNPRVGCVITKGDRIIGEGWHERAGEAHAEVAALRSAKESVAGATAYVTLEPCSHHGRTPPCVNALIEARIARVVFAVQDPNPRVSGQGADALLRSGMTVEAGLMEAEAREINIGFMKRMKDGLPWVRVKLAMSLDGRTALANGASQWITSEAARNDVQRWRARCSAIMTGVGSVLADDPLLNVRAAGFKGRQPLRVVLDSRLRCPPAAKMLVGLGAGAGPAGAGGSAGSAVAGAVGAGGHGGAAGAGAAGRGGAAVAGAAGAAGAASAAGVAGAAALTGAAGPVLIFTATGGGSPAASAARSAAPVAPETLSDDLAALVSAFESSPTSVSARSADVAGPASVKTEAPPVARVAPVAAGPAGATGAAGSAAAPVPAAAPGVGAVGAAGVGAPSGGATPGASTASAATGVGATAGAAAGPSAAVGTETGAAGASAGAKGPTTNADGPVSDDATWAGAALSGAKAVPLAAKSAEGTDAPATAASGSTAPTAIGAPLPMPGSATPAPNAPPAAAAAASPTAAVAAAAIAAGAAPAAPTVASAATAASAPAPSTASSAPASAVAGGVTPKASPDAATASPVGSAGSSAPPSTVPTLGAAPSVPPAAAAPSAPAPASAGAGTSAAVGAKTSATPAAPQAAPTSKPAAATADSPAALQARRAVLLARGARIEEVPADDGFLDLFAVLQKLAELEVNEVLVEAGPTLAGQLLTTFFADELLLYIAPKLLGPQGRPLVNLPELQSLQDAWGFALFDAKRFGDDLRLRLRPK